MFVRIGYITESDRMANKHAAHSRADHWHMSEEETKRALELLADRNLMIQINGVPGVDLSFEAIGHSVGHSGEAIRQLSSRDMDPLAIEARYNDKIHSKNILDSHKELIAAGWIVCHDLLRKCTSSVAFADYLRTSL